METQFWLYIQDSQVIQLFLLSLHSIKSKWKILDIVTVIINAVANVRERVSVGLEVRGVIFYRNISDPTIELKKWMNLY